MGDAYQIPAEEFDFLYQTYLSCSRVAATLNSEVDLRFVRLALIQTFGRLFSAATSTLRLRSRPEFLQTLKQNVSVLQKKELDPAELRLAFLSSRFFQVCIVGSSPAQHLKHKFVRSISPCHRLLLLVLLMPLSTSISASVRKFGSRIGFSSACWRIRGHAPLLPPSWPTRSMLCFEFKALPPSGTHSLSSPACFQRHEAVAREKRISSERRRANS